MKEIKISDFNEFNEIILSHSTTNYLFRGQTNSKWPLIPKIGRPEYYKSLTKTLKEEDIINSWGRYSEHHLINVSSG